MRPLGRIIWSWIEYWHVVSEEIQEKMVIGERPKPQSSLAIRFRQWTSGTCRRSMFGSLSLSNDETSIIMSNYDQLHRQCRTLENLFDSKLTSYSQLASSISRPGRDIESSGSSERWKDLELELDDLSVKVCTPGYQFILLFA
jgi:hypothetical protein